MADPLPSISIGETIHRIQVSLLETPASTERQIFGAAALLSRPDYEDIVVERSIANLCGYPLCPNPLPSDRPQKGRYRVSLREHRVYDLQETYKYCSPDCVVNSRAYSASLNEERCADVGPSKFEQVLGLFGHEGREEGLGKDGDLGISNLEIRETRDAGAREVKLDDWIGASNAIEGYVPQHDRGSKSTSNAESLKKAHDAGVNEVDFTSSMYVGDRIDGALPKGSSVSTEDVSEMIAKKLEDVVLTEKKKTNKTSSRSSTTKTPKKASNNEGDNMDLGEVGFTSSILAGDEVDEVLPETSFPTTQDVSEMITKRLENVVLEERKMATSKTSPRSSRHKPKKKANGNKSNKVDPKSTINIDDRVTAVALSTSSVSTQDYSKQLGKELKGEVHLDNIADPKGTDFIEYEDGLYSEKKTEPMETELKKLRDGDCSGNKVPQGTVLKSSLKTSGSKAGNRSVKWADKREVLEDRKDVSKDVHMEDDDISLRLASAEACAAALTQAAEAAISGEVESGDAVSEAGILILPQLQPGKEVDPEADEDVFEFDHGYLKWPKKTVLLETDMFDVEDSWHDTPPEGFSLTLSSFATMWMALFGWITCSSLAYIYGRDESSQEDFLLVNGREYPHKITLRDGKSSEIRQALDGFICRALPGLVMDLRLPTPVSTLEKFVGRLLDTMSFVDALPSFRIKQWQVIVLLFIDALSVHRLPTLAPHMTSRDMLLHKVLSAAGVTNEEYETMRDLYLPLGRLPQFSMQSGG